MNSYRGTPGCRRLDLRLGVAGALAGAALCSTGIADPVFDPLATSAALGSRTSGLTDPLGRECTLSPEPLTLAAAVDLALCRDPSTRAAWTAARQQAAALGSAESAWLPSVSATGQDVWTDGLRENIVGNLLSSSQRTTDAALNLSWTLYDFGARGGRITSAQRLLDAAAATVNSVAQRTVFNVVQTYYGVVAADAELVAAKTNETAYARSLEVARHRREGGVATLADVLQAETAFDQVVLARVQADAAVQSARGTLAVAIGSAADQRLTLAAEPVPADVPALAARMEDLMAEATRQRPDLAAARARRDAAIADVAVARAAGRPSISVGAARNYSEIPGFPNQNYNALALTVTVPLFTGFNSTYGVHEAQAALQAREANAEQIRLAVSLDVWNGYYALDSAGQQLKATAALINSAEENEQVAQGRYESGVGTIVDVLTAEAAAVLARQQRIAAERGWQVARAQFALALGRLTGAEPLPGRAALP